MKQINLRLSEELRKEVEKYAKKHGYKNVQELAKDAIRMKVFEEESIKETLEIMKNPELMASIERSRRDVEKGRVFTFKSISELRKRYK